MWLHEIHFGCGNGDCQAIFAATSRQFFLFGPRGTGKSTWLAQEFPGALRLDLLAPEVLRAYLARPERPSSW